MNDHVTFLTGWAADIRGSSGKSIDADCLESAASEISRLQTENASLLVALKAAHTTLKVASRQLTEDHKMVLMGRGWGWKTLATIEGVIAKSEAKY